jgi:hypothetical protein
MVRVELPSNLCRLAGVSREVLVIVEEPVTQRRILDAVEADYPMLRGTICDHVTRIRRPFIRFFACGEDLSHQSMDEPVPAAVSGGVEPFLILGAIAGG